MNIKKINIEQRSSAKDFNILYYFLVFFVILFLINLSMFGFNEFAKISSTIIIIIVVLPLLIRLDPSLKERYLSEIHITEDFITLVYKIGSEIIEERQIEKSEILKFKIDINIKEESSIYDKQKISICPYLGFVIKLANKECISNFNELNKDFQEARIQRINLREKIKNTQDKEKKAKLIKTYEFLCDLDEKYSEDIISQAMLRGYDFVFDFISYKKHIPNCELNINTNSKCAKKEIEYYTKYGKKLPFIFKLLYAPQYKKLVLGAIIWIVFILITICMGYILK